MLKKSLHSLFNLLKSIPDQQARKWAFTCLGPDDCLPLSLGKIRSDTFKPYS